MSHSTNDAIGDRGVQIFAPFFDAARVCVSDTTDCAMTGSFHRLPVELVQCIVVAVLESDGALVSMRALGSFLRTCRGAAAAVAREHRLEAAARAFLGNTLKPLTGVAPHRAYTELLVTYMRSRMEHACALRMLRDITLHCASLTSGPCCRKSREAYNDELKGEEWWWRWGFMGELVKEATAPERPVMRIAVAAARGSQVLCRTDRGAALTTKPLTLTGGCVRCVENRPCEVFSPERELEVTFEQSFDDAVLLGASAGKLFAVVLVHMINDNAWENQYALQVWDMEANARVYARAIDPYPIELWILDERVYWLTNGHETDKHRWSLHLEQCLPLTGEYERVQLPDSHFLDATSVSRHTGDLAMIDANPDQSIEQLLFFDVKLKQLRSVNSFARISRVRRSLVQISPMGNTMVLVGTSHQTPTTSIYRRFPASSFPDIGKTRLLGWALWKTIVPRSDACFPQRLNYPTQHGAFSPCGGMVHFFFLSGERSEGMHLDVRRVLEGEDVQAVVLQYVPNAVPPTKSAWGTCGLFLPTGTGGGVLRIGA